VDRSGVAKTGRGSHIITRQPNGQLAADVPHCEVTVLSDAGDGPAISVFNPVRGAESATPIIGAGDDHVADTRPVSVPQTHFSPGRSTVATLIAGSAVELGDKLAGWSEHDRVQSNRSILNLSGKGIVGDLGEITDMNTTMIEIEAECAGIAFPQGERGLCFGRIGEAV
jgi:hypothetical protein